MSLSEPVLAGPGAGRTVTKSSGSSTELKLDGEQAGAVPVNANHMMRPATADNAAGQTQRPPSRACGGSL